MTEQVSVNLKIWKCENVEIVFSASSQNIADGDIPLRLAGGVAAGEKNTLQISYLQSFAC